MNTDDKSSDPMPRIAPGAPARDRLASPHPALVLGIVLVATLGAQAWLAASDARRTAQLRDTLSRSHTLASALESAIGYGGLIHEFKNYVLRPDEDGYRQAALDDARDALVLAERLSRNAAELGFRAKLEDTRTMIESYADRLDQVRELSVNGRDPSYVDERVRFDDAPALLETGQLVAAIDANVADRLTALEYRGAIANVLATAATAAMGLLCIGVITRRGRRHAAVLEAMNDELAGSNAELARANVSLSQFAGVVSHDLRTPLRHVELANAMMADDPDDAATVAECVDIVGRSALRMESIVTGLLDFTKTGFTTPRPKAIDPATLLADVVDDLGLEARTDGARVELDVALEPGTRLHADPVLLARVFSNLTGNSLKYAREGVPPRIAIRIERTGPDGSGAVACSVADNGIGIEPRFASRIFEPMERLHDHDSAYEGVGIGLSLARSIVAGHGGDIHLDTAFEGGTRFVFELPRERLILPPEHRKAA